VKVKLEGFKEMDEALGELTKAAARGVLKRTATKALQPVAWMAKSLVPVDQGHLQKSIIVSDKVSGKKQNAGTRAYADVMASGGSASSAQAALRAANRAAKTGGLSVTMYAGPGQHPQAIFQEFGTFKEPPQPFLRPAWDGSKGGVFATVKADLTIEIAKAAKRAAAKAARLAKAAGG
jgi:HK97 gp10 family phage protein